MSGYPVSDLLFISGYVSQLYRWDLQNVTFKVTTHSCGEDLRQKNYVKDYVDTYFWERKHGVRPVLVAMGLARVQEVRIPALNTWWTFFTLNCNNSSKTLKISKKRLGMANLKDVSNLVEWLRKKTCSRDCGFKSQCYSTLDWKLFTWLCCKNCTVV